MQLRAEGHEVRDLVRRVARSLRVAAILPLPVALKLYSGTDKVSHGYGRVYGRWLRGLRLRRFALLEIGVLRGGSLRVWRDLFPRATVVGIDIDPPGLDMGRRVRIERADQSTASDVAAALAGLRPPHVVIDDGSHRGDGDDVWATFRYLFPLMPSGGIYIIEDLLTSYWPEFGGEVPTPAGSAVGLARELIDAVQGSAVVHGWFGGTTAQRPAPVSEFSAVEAVDVVPNALIVERA